NRSRCNNLRIVGLPENTATSSLVSFLEDWFHLWMPADHLTAWFPIERAHGALQSRPPPGFPPRPLILHLFNFKDRDALLQDALTRRDLFCDGVKVLLFPDYTRDVQLQ
ncbi:hypothetical protein NDU88_006973, partial [Pleurodeles waltl]